MKRAMAARRCACVWKLTKAQFDREMRKMLATPPYKPGEDPSDDEAEEDGAEELAPGVGD